MSNGQYADLNMDMLNFSGDHSVVMAVACYKCRCVVFTFSAEFAVENAVFHGEKCQSSDVAVIEVLPPVGAKLLEGGS